MGNAQSAGHPHNRLVKPKTNSNSPYLAPTRYASADSPLNLSTHFAQLSTRDRQQIKSQLLSPVETEVGLGDIPDFEKDLEGEPVTVNVTRRNSSRSNSLSCFGSKASSTTKLASLGASKVSLGLNSQAGEIEAAIQILQEAQKNASPEDVAAIRECLCGSFLPRISLTQSPQSKLSSLTLCPRLLTVHPVPRQVSLGAILSCIDPLRLSSGVVLLRQHQEPQRATRLFNKTAERGIRGKLLKWIPKKTQNGVPRTNWHYPGSLRLKRYKRIPHHERRPLRTCRTSERCNWAL